MWVANLIIKHNCLIGNKCKKYKVSTISVPFDVYVDKNITYSPEFHTLWGDDNNIKSFIKALKKDRQLHNIEVNGNKVFLVEVIKRKIPVSIRGSLQQKVIWTKPISINDKGEENWEIASWNKMYIIKFIEDVKKISNYVNVKFIKNTKLTDIYYTRLLPGLSKKQKESIILAFKEGYYNYPRKIDLHALSKIMKVSVPTFREHLKRAEEKLLPDLIKQL